MLDKNSIKNEDLRGTKNSSNLHVLQKNDGVITQP